MKKSEKINEDTDTSLRNNVRVGEVVKERYREIFHGMTRAEMLEELKTWKDSDLKWLCEQVALPTEDYEICQCVSVVMHGRDLMKDV